MGVSHKFCSSSDLEKALQHHRIEVHIRQEKLESIQMQLLHDSWQYSTTAKPYLEALVGLIESGQLTEFDFSFLKNWIGKKSKGQYFYADEQARALAILYSNKLGETIHSLHLCLLVHARLK